jgi:hypothetical protein
MPANSDATPLLNLPYIAAAQAQKHVTHNEAIRMLDALLQIAVVDRDLAAPPAAPLDGERFIIAAAPTGVWAGHAGHIAAFQDGAWAFFEPREGWIVWVSDENMLLAWSGTAWIAAAAMPLLNPTAMIGINATADSTNRLAIAAPSSLFNHDGQGHQIKLNKAAASNTASLLFQTGFSGRAEFGTTGDDHLHIKVSATGATWSEALVINSATGNVGLGVTPSAFRLDLGPAALRSGSGVFDRPVGNAADFYFQRATLGRWNFGMSAEAETGANAGSNFFINRFSDTGAYIGTPISITRATGALNLFGDARTHGLRGATDNTYSLGTAAARWSQVWAANGTIQTSDARDKVDVEPIDGAMALRMIDAVDPITFRWKVGGNEVTGIDPATGAPIVVPRPGKRRHAGFRAQDIRAACRQSGLDKARPDKADIDLGVWGLDRDDDPASRQWLRPDQLIPILWAAVRDLQRRVDVKS